MYKLEGALEMQRTQPHSEAQPSSCASHSANNCLHRTGLLDAREALIEALILVGKFLMIDPEQVKQGGLEVADMDGIFDDVVGELVGLSMDDPSFDSAAGHP